MIDLLIVVFGPASIALGLYTKDWFVIWFGVIYTTLLIPFVVAHLLRRHNEQQAISQARLRQNELIERFLDKQERKSGQDISR